MGTVGAESHGVVVGVLDVRDHVLGSLVLELLQASLDCVQNLDLVDERDVLLCLLHFFHQVWVTTDILDSIEKLLALFHDLIVHLNAALLG